VVVTQGSESMIATTRTIDTAHGRLTIREEGDRVVIDLVPETDCRVVAILPEMNTRRARAIFYRKGTDPEEERA
jgi:hypothetical protein